jgi:flagellar M-ring protein FliF
MIGSRRRSKKLDKLLKAEVAEANADRAALEASGARAIEADGGADARLAIAPGGSDDGLAAEREARQRELSSLVEQQPEEVAQVLRGWLADRRG